MDNIKISVVIPFFNMERYIGACLDNVLQQTLEEIEIICVDDGSTDGSREIAAAYEGKNAKIVVIYQNNQGSGPARNAAINRARGKYIAFMDADDYYPNENVLERLYITAERENVVICGGSLILDREGQKITDEKSKRHFTRTGLMEYREYQYVLGYTRFIFRTSFLRENRIYFPAYRRFQDPPFLARAMICAKSFFAVATDVYVYRTFDRTPLFQSFEVVNDLAKGIGDVLKMSVEGHFEKMQGDMVQKVLGHISNFYKSIYQGNETLAELLDRLQSYMDEGLLREDGRFMEKPRLMAKDEIKEYLDGIYEKEHRLWKKINNFSMLVIYGAGVVGQDLYKYLMQKGYNGMVEFGVTFPKENEVIFGKKVRNLREYLPKCKEALVLVAASKKNAPDMIEYAEKQGFEQIERVNWEDLQVFKKWEMGV